MKKFNKIKIIINLLKKVIITVVLMIKINKIYNLIKRLKKLLLIILIVMQIKVRVEAIITVKLKKIKIKYMNYKC